MSGDVAWKDEEPVACSLAEALVAKGVRVWYDELALHVSDRLQHTVDHGLAHYRYGIVIVSPHFLAKEFLQKELDGLSQREN